MSPKKNQKRRPVTVMWRETARDKAKRWVQDGTDGARLAQLGVPLNLMNSAQRFEVGAARV